MSVNILTSVLPDFGVEINNVNFADMSDCNIGILIDLYNQHHLLVIRGQELSENQLINISKVFGKPVPALVPTHRLENYPVITRHTNVKDENKTPLGVVAPEYVFHSDSYFVANPSKATLLYSVHAPEVGGETCFVDMVYAYDTLTNSLKSMIADKRAIYKNAYINQPPVMHPLVRIHPITKRQALFINKHRALGIDGMERDDAMTLINELYSHAIRSEFIYKHKWRDGDLLVWNNPTTMHCATPIPDSQIRILYRILTQGDLPVN